MQIQGMPSHETFYRAALAEEGEVSPIEGGRFEKYKLRFKSGIEAILKPMAHSTDKFRGIPVDTMYRREAAAYQFDRLITRFNVIPPTTLTIFKGRPASIQAFVDGLHASEVQSGIWDEGERGWKQRVGMFASKVDINHLRKLVIFDLLVNNTDRHGKNVIFDTIAHHVYGIDNGLCFGRYYAKYNDAFHRLLFRHSLKLTSSERAMLEAVSVDDLTVALKRYLQPVEIQDTYLRIQWVLNQPSLGYLDMTDGDPKFLSQKEWFLQQRSRGRTRNRMLARIEKMGEMTVA